MRAFKWRATEDGQDSRCSCCGLFKACDWSGICFNCAEGLYEDACEREQEARRDDD